MDIFLYIRIFHGNAVYNKFDVGKKCNYVNFIYKIIYLFSTVRATLAIITITGFTFKDY